MIESRLFLYTAIAILSLSFTILGYFALASYPSIGAILGFLVGGALSALLIQMNLTLRDYHKLLNRHLEQQNQKLMRVEQEIDKIKALNLEGIQDSYAAELQTMSRQNQWQKEIIEKLDALYLSLKFQEETEPESSITPSTTKSDGEKHPKLNQWLQSCQAEVMSFGIERPMKNSLKNIATFIDKHYRHLSDLMEKICNSIATNCQEFELNLSTQKPKELSVINNLGDRLKREHLLDYEYQNKGGGSRSAKITPLMNGDTEFLAGVWFEVSIYQKINKLLRGKNFRYNVIPNVKLRAANEQVREIDFVVLLNDQPLFIDCDIMVTENDIDGYADFCQNFNLQLHQIYFIGRELKQSNANAWTKKYGVQVINSSQIPEVLGNNIKLFTT